MPSRHEEVTGVVPGLIPGHPLLLKETGTLLDYLDYLLDAYLMFLVSLRSRSEKQRMVNARKVYAIDPGLAAAMYGGGAVNTGVQLECFVYLEPRRRLGVLAQAAVAYYRKKSGFEVDFVIDPVLPPRVPSVSCRRGMGAGARGNGVKARLVRFRDGCAE